MRKGGEENEDTSRGINDCDNDTYEEGAGDCIQTKHCVDIRN